MESANMKESLSQREYKGDGKQRYTPLAGAVISPEPFIAPEGLRDAVNMALYLRRPLLLEGEPGVGKTRLAYAIAYELGFPLKVVSVRSTSQAKELLYTFDAINRLYAIQEHGLALAHLHQVAMQDGSGEQTALKQPSKNPLDKTNYVKLQGLGEAIRLSQEQDIPSVVLIDEIDKADIDFPNDLLLVLDRLQFQIDEIPERSYDALKGQTREERQPFLPLVIITSNREKELPIPFLRRCLFYRIPFPERETLAKILQVHFANDLGELAQVALNKFWQLRTLNSIKWRKAPTTSELIDWLRILEYSAGQQQMTAQTLKETPLAQLPFLPALLKVDSDVRALRRLTVENET